MHLFFLTPILGSPDSGFGLPAFSFWIGLFLFQLYSFCFFFFFKLVRERKIILISTRRKLVLALAFTNILHRHFYFIWRNDILHHSYIYATQRFSNMNIYWFLFPFALSFFPSSCFKIWDRVVIGIGDYRWWCYF